MEFFGLGVSIPLALAAVTLLGYVFGRRRSGNQPVRESAEVEDLVQVTAQIRQSLAIHHASILRLNDRILRFRHAPNESELDELSAEAERMLQPNKQLSTQLAQAYDELRQQANKIGREHETVG